MLVVDNHDSFVFTLVGYLTELGARVTVVEADEITDVGATVAGHDAVMISPGPGTPTDAGASIDVVRWAARWRVPLLGVCLGHQAIAEAFGARIIRAPQPMHGRTSALSHDGIGVLRDQPDLVRVGRYHSLAVDEGSLPAELVVSARSEDGVVMVISHRELPIVGLQFHPESVLTERGHLLLARWLDGVRDTGAVERARLMSPRAAVMD